MVDLVLVDPDLFWVGYRKRSLQTSFLANISVMLSCSVTRKAEVANIVAVPSSPPNSQCRHKIVLVLMNIHRQSDFLVETAGCACDLEKGTTVKPKTNTNTFIGPTKAARCVCFLQQASRLPSGCFICIKHHPESWAVFNVPWAEQCLGTPSYCPTSGSVHFPAWGVAVGLSSYQLSVTIATPHLTSPCTKNRSPWSQGKKTKGNQKGQW